MANVTNCLLQDKITADAYKRLDDRDKTIHKLEKENKEMKRVSSGSPQVAVGGPQSLSR